MNELKSFLHNLDKESNLTPEQKAEFFQVLMKMFRKAEKLDGRPRARIQFWKLCNHPTIIQLGVRIRAKRIALTQLLQQVFDLLMTPLDFHLANGITLCGTSERAYVFLGILQSRFCKPALALIAPATATGLAAAAGVGYGLHSNPFWYYTLSILNLASAILATTSLLLAFATVFLALLGLLDRPSYLTKSPSLS